MRRRPLLLLLALAVLFAAWGAWQRTENDSRIDGSKAESHETRHPLLSADGRPPAAVEPELSEPGKETEKDVEHSDVEVQVVSRFGEDLPAMPLHVLYPGKERPTLVHTDATGRAMLRDVPLDGSVHLRTLVYNGVLSSVKTPATAISERSMRLVAEHSILMELDARDAETGESVPGVRWRFSNQRYRSPLEVSGEDPLALPLERGIRALIKLEVAAPKGWVDWDGGDHWVRLLPTARRLRIVHPLRREARVVLDMKGPADEPSLSPVVLGFFLPGGPRARMLWQAPDNDRQLRIAGIPFIRGAPLAILVGDRAHAHDYALSPQSIAAKARGEKRPWRGNAKGRCLVEARLPDAPTDECLIQGELPGLSDREQGPRFTLGRDGTTERQAAYRLQEAGSTVPSGSSTLTVRVLDPEGQPLPDAYVSVGQPRKWVTYEQTEQDGVIVLDALPAGNCTVSMGGPGLLPVRTRATLKAGEATVIALHEPTGAELRVRVVDAAGRGVPFAAVSVSKPGPAGVLQDGLQTVNPYTDARGTWVLRRLPAGERTVSVARVLRRRSASCVWSGRTDPVGRWGRGRATVTLEEGRTTEIVLDAPK